MCGVIGISSFKSLSNFDEKNILNKIKHRGPDDEGSFYCNERKTFLGHVRLSIVDTSSSGKQPMTSQCGRYVISYNGEVYNYLNLKAEINKQRNIEWKSSSDTEIIIEGVSLFGTNFLKKLNGIFSILIYDLKNNMLHILRDPLGIKPLYYADFGNQIYFASEVKVFKYFPNNKLTIRNQSLYDQLNYMFVPEPYTMYNEIKKVQPGYLLTYKGGELVEKTEYFTKLFSKPKDYNFNDVKDLFYNQFNLAIKNQVNADVPVSLFLSGGLDSSAVAYEASKYTKIDSAYTIAYSEYDNSRDGQTPDLYYAKKMAKSLGLNLNVIEANVNFLDYLPKIIDFMEDGISDPAAINTYLISKNARDNGIKVMLSGQGADEYLCGYRRYQAENIYSKLYWPQKTAINLISSVTPSNLHGKINPYIRRLKKFSGFIKMKRKDRISSYYSWADDFLVNSIFNETISGKSRFSIKKFIDNNHQLNNLELMEKIDFNFDLMSLNLSYSDKMSMAVGLELRVPFLDFDLIKLMTSFKKDLKLNNNTTKYILKKSFENKLPREIIYRSKSGFGLPIRSWLSKSSKLIDYYFSKKNIDRFDYYNFDSINAILKNQKNGKTDNSYLIFALLCQFMWLEKNIK